MRACYASPIHCARNVLYTPTNSNFLRIISGMRFLVLMHAGRAGFIAGEGGRRFMHAERVGFSHGEGGMVYAR